MRPLPASPPPMKAFNPANEPLPLRARRHQRRRDLQQSAPSENLSHGSSTKMLLSTSTAPSVASITPPLRKPLAEKNVASDSVVTFERDQHGSDKTVSSRSRMTLEVVVDVPPSTRSATPASKVKEGTSSDETPIVQEKEKEKTPAVKPKATRASRAANKKAIPITSDKSEATEQETTRKGSRNVPKPVLKVATDQTIAPDSKFSGSKTNLSDKKASPSDLAPEAPPLHHPVETQEELVPLFFTQTQDDLSNVQLDIPPSSPGRFARWNKATLTNSDDDDLEYIDDNRHSEHRMIEEQKGRKGSLGTGRLGAASSVISPMDLVNENDKFVAASNQPEATPMPLHSTPLQRKTKEKTPSNDLNVKPREKLVPGEKDLYRMYGIDSDDESGEEPVLVEVQKSKLIASSEGVAETKQKEKEAKRKNTSTKPAIPKKDVAMAKKSRENFSAAKQEKMHIQVKSREVDSTEMETNKLAKFDNKADDTMKSKETRQGEDSLKKTVTKADKAVERKRPPPMGIAETKPTKDDVAFPDCDEHPIEEADDIFGFGVSQRNVSLIRSQKSKKKTTDGEVDTTTILEKVDEEGQEAQSQTQSGGQFTATANVKSTKVAPRAFDDREDSVPILDFDKLNKVAQEANVERQAEQEAEIAAKMSSELTDLDSDLEDDIQSKVIKARKGGKVVKAKQSDAVIEEDKPKTVEEIMALARGDSDGPTSKHSTKKSTTVKGSKKVVGKGRKLDLNEEEEAQTKTSKPKKSRTLALRATPTSSQTEKPKKTAAVIDLDDYDVPPGMTTKDVMKSRASNIKSKTASTKTMKKAVSTEVEKASNASVVKSRPRPRLTIKEQIIDEDVDWDEQPMARSSTTAKRKAKTQAKEAIEAMTEVVAVDSQTQPIITPALKRKQKRAKLTNYSDDEEENATTIQSQKERLKYFESLNNFQLDVENV